MAVDDVEFSAILWDCGRAGCQLTLQTSLEPEQKARIKLGIPDEERPIEVVATVVWCEPIGYSSSYLIGFSFCQFLYPPDYHRLALAIEKGRMNTRRQMSLTPLPKEESLGQLSPLEVQRIVFLTTLSRRLNSSHDLGEIASTAVTTLASAMRAERVMLMLDRGGSEPEVVAGWGIEPEPSDGPCLHTYPFSRSIAHRVLTEGKALLSLDVESDEELSESASLEILGTRSVLCLPLLSGERVFGLIYMDNRIDKAAFSYDDLEIARVLSELVAAAVERGRLLSLLVQTEKMSALGTLTASLAHELKNPLTVVTGIVQLLRQGVPADAELIEDLGEAADRCCGLIADIANWSRLDDEAPDEIHFEDVLSATLPMVRAEILRAGVQFQTSVEANLPAVRGHVNKLSQVLVNLISNSLQALQGREEPKLTLQVTANDSDLFVRVNDNGPGIPAENLARIFDPFFTTKPRGVGTGLGLSISRDILSRYGGSLEARNLPSGGAQLLLQLPALTRRSPCAALGM